MRLDPPAATLHEFLTSSIHTWMFGTPRHPDLGVHVALDVEDHYRITVKHKSRRNAA
jgi:hypothetical protein